MTGDMPHVGATFYLNPTKTDFSNQINLLSFLEGKVLRGSCESFCQSERWGVRSDGKKSLAEGDFKSEQLTAQAVGAA